MRMLVVTSHPRGGVPLRAERVAAAVASGRRWRAAGGHLAMTIDQGPDMSRYQGLVALEGGSLEDAAHEYFKNSEQIPTRVRLAVGEEFSAGAVHRWRAGGILVQFLPRDPERARVADLDPGDAPEGTPVHVVPEDDAWVEARSLIATVEDLELLDPALSSESLVYRLFHEHDVRVFRNRDVVARCSCSRAGVEAMLKNFSQDDRDHMVENGRISVTCEFCSANYVFTPEGPTLGLIDRALLLRGVEREGRCRCRIPAAAVTMP